MYIIHDASAITIGLSENTTCVRPRDEEEDDDEDTRDGDDDSDDDREEIADREELDQITSEEEDEEQMEEDRRARGLLLGASARRTARRFRRAQIRCNRDDYCKRIGLTRSVCATRNMNGKRKYCLHV